MHTCLLCNRPDEALEVFDEFVDLDAGEWQWAGGQDRLDPLCRDLAMQALGGSTGSGVSARALKLFQETQEDAVTVSAAALNGVVCACEKDGNWEDTVALLFSTLNKPDAFRSIVSSDELDITDVESPRQTSPTMYRELGLLLNSVMRTCNTNKQFGVALLCLRLFELSLPSSVPAYYQEHLDNGLDPMERSLVPVLCETGNTEDCLASTIISLCGVSCPSEATAVFNTVKSIEGGQDMFHASAVNDFALSKASHTKTNQLYEKWHAAWRHMHRITAAISILRATGERMAPEQAELLSSSLATALRCCTAALHPEAGLHLAQWVEGGTDRQNSTEGMLGVLPLTDTLVAAIMEAYNATDGHTVALDFFEAQAIAERPDSQWTLSYNAALDALFSLDRHQDGIALFRQALALHRNPDMFCITAKRLVASKKWEAMGDVYRLALTSGCLSEELCKFALVAISSGRQKGTMPRLRSIVEEAAKLTDTDSASWLISKYWSLKRILGFTTVRGLMWWDDPRTAHLDELEFAFATLEKRATTGFTPKNDALRLIATAARTFQEDSIPPNRTGLPHVPRTREGWIDTMARVLIEAKETTLLDSSNFITDVAVALRRLDCDVECVGVVSDALARGVWLDDRALEEASAAARNAGMEGRTVDDIQMLVTDTTSREQRQ
jgi:tetratricopeptide (TPR) repeat protein